MKTQIQKPKQESRTIQSKTKAANQAPLGQILQRYKDKTIQREVFPDEDELLQGKFETIQKEKFEDEDLLQGKFDKTAQLMDFDEEEPLQQKSISTSSVQRKESPNRTGLPDNLKSGIENMSGYSMDDVRVHYNSSKPAQLQALAYTQGTDIHVAPGQEKHLPHEAWHVVQQKQGRVQPTMQLQGVNVNDNEGLEKEADVMGRETAIQKKRNKKNNKHASLKYTNYKTYINYLSNVSSSNSIVQRENGLKEEDEVYVKEKGYGKIEKIAYPRYRVKINGKSYWALQKDVINAKGTFEVFDFTKPEQYQQEDESFKIFAEDSKIEKDSEIIIGVVDTGIASLNGFLKEKIVKRYDLFKEEGKEEITHDNIKIYEDALIDLHGTRVAGQAAYGNLRIKIIDIKIQSAQISNKTDDEYERIAGLMKKAIQNGARIITSSISIDWSKPVIQDAVRENPKVLFLMTAGNENVEFSTRPIDKITDVSKKFEYSNALLIGGIKLDGKKHPSRGFGKGIDVTVPSGMEISGTSMTLIQPYIIQKVKSIKSMDVEKCKDDFNTIISRLNKKNQSLPLCLKQKEHENIIAQLASLQERFNNITYSQYLEISGEIQIITDKLKGIIGNLKQFIELNDELFNTAFRNIDSLINDIYIENKQDSIAHDDGVSFGIPVIANVAAKMMLLNPKLTGLDTAAIIKESYYTKEELKQIYGQGEGELNDYSDKMLNPILAYQKALQWKK